MSNTLIDLEGLKAFYRKILTEDLAEYARYDSLSPPPAIIAPTVNGGVAMIAITNNDSRPLTFYYGREESLDKDNPNSFEVSIRIDAGEHKSCTTKYVGTYYVKAYADDDTESSIYTVTVVSGWHGGGTDD